MKTATTQQQQKAEKAVREEEKNVCDVMKAKERKCFKERAVSCVSCAEK